MEPNPANFNELRPRRRLHWSVEPTAAGLATLGLTALLILTACYAGPLWRDEVNTINVAQMPSWSAMSQSLQFESFPPLWPLLLRAASWLGLAGSDASIRLLGLSAGLFFMGVLWLSARWLGCHAPTLTLALLGTLPAFIFMMSSNRAYGLATGLMVLSYGLLWRMLESPTRTRVLLTGIVCLFFVHCVYYDAFFLAGMLVGGMLVANRRRQWQTLAALLGMGGICAVSLLIYWPIIHQGSAYGPLIERPEFGFSTMWDRMRMTVTSRLSGEPTKPGPEIWLWLGLVAFGLVVAWSAQKNCAGPLQAPAPAVGNRNRRDSDLAVYCATSMLIGSCAYLAFLSRLHYFTQSWYYVEMLCLCALSLDALLGANWPALRPWGWWRIVFLVVMTGWGAGGAWKEAHTRRSNVDLIATTITQKAEVGDLIIVNGAWEGITFNRYYHGPVHWETIPPVASHLVHRNDLMIAQLKESEPMAPVLREITSTLQSGHKVWLAGGFLPTRPVLPPPGPLAERRDALSVYWGAQVATALVQQARNVEFIKIIAGGPVSGLENLRLIVFFGTKPDWKPSAAAR